MSDTVTETAFGELGHHGCRVTVAVTALALRYHLVFCLMAGNTGKLAVLEFAGSKEIKGLLVAGRAIFGRRFVAIGHVLRHVSLMTFFAVSDNLISRVRFVALGTVRDFAMFVVAEAAGKGGMLALVVAQFDDLSGMTGHAGIGYVVAKGNVERCVRIGMTSGTGSQFVMSFPFMALTTERNDLLCRGRVAVVAILAADLCFMLAPGSCNISRSLCVTFGAILIG